MDRVTLLKIGGLVAAAAIAIRGILDLREGGAALLIVAAVILIAVALRHFGFRG